jgi:mannose-6-phosphate isomerase-like protein (cupin superfamily)
MEVEGRIYALSPFDNIAIPSGVAHAAFNPSSRQPAVLYAAVPTTCLERTLEERFFSRRSMPAGASGPPGAEQVTRLADAPRFPIGPNAESLDYCNGELMPGLEVSAGYCVMRPNGRTAAILREADEAILVVSGTARCLVEGRAYTVGEGDAMLLPRGRVHRFANEGTEVVVMLWVCAGGQSSFLVVESSCAEQDPWEETHPPT